MLQRAVPPGLSGLDLFTDLFFIAVVLQLSKHVADSEGKESVGRWVLVFFSVFFGTTLLTGVILSLIGIGSLSATILHFVRLVWKPR